MGTVTRTQWKRRVTRTRWVMRVTRWVNHEESDEDDDDSKGEVNDKYIRVDQDTSQSSFACQQIYSLIKIKNKKFTYKSRGLGQAKPEPSPESWLWPGLRF